MQSPVTLEVMLHSWEIHNCKTSQPSGKLYKKSDYVVVIFY